MAPLPSSMIMITWFALLAMAAASDVTTRRIPNELVVLIAIVSVALRSDGPTVTGYLDGLFAGLVIGIAMAIAWRRKLVGAGDVKLAAAVAIGVGTTRLASFVLAAALATGVVAIASWVASTATARRDIKANLATLALGVFPQMKAGVGRRNVPCAVAIMIGAATAMLWGR